VLLFHDVLGIGRVRLGRVHVLGGDRVVGLDSRMLHVGVAALLAFGRRRVRRGARGHPSVLGLAIVAAAG
jgi:hypothetical protein